MTNDIINFFEVERQIFGICPKCNDFFRLSECNIFLKGEKTQDWMDKLKKSQERLDVQTEMIEEKREELQAVANEKGRKQAQEVIKSIDRVFTPKGLNADDAKVIFNPIDYVVFNGMNGEEKTINNVVLLDRERTDNNSKKIQRSIEKAIEAGNYEWKTIIISDTGEIKYK